MRSSPSGILRNEPQGGSHWEEAMCGLSDACTCIQPPWDYTRQPGSLRSSRKRDGVSLGQTRTASSNTMDCIATDRNFKVEILKIRPNVKILQIVHKYCN